jgi:hypothetical protein
VIGLIVLFYDLVWLCCHYRSSFPLTLAGVDHFLSCLSHHRNDSAWGGLSHRRRALHDVYDYYFERNRL